MSGGKKYDLMARETDGNKDRIEKEIPYITQKSSNLNAAPPPNLGNVKSRQTARDQDSYIGFANLPNQVYRKSVKRGFEFTMMVVGEIISFILSIYHHQCLYEYLINFDQRN